MSNVFIAYDADNAGRLIGHARLSDNPAELAKVSNSIDQGNEIFKAWALDHGGSVISAGGDEGILEVPAVSLQDLPAIKTKYETALELTTSIGVGLKMSEAFKALLVAKLRGKNRVVMYDDEVGKEIASASKDDEKKKIVTEYLTKHQVVHHTGAAGEPAYRNHQDGNPEIQQQQTLEGMPDIQVPEDQPDFEGEFRKLAQEQENKSRIRAAKRSGNIQEVKQKLAKVLEAIHQQLPTLAQLKQAAPDTYAAVLGLVQGVVAIGRQISDNEQQLEKAEPSRLRWTGGGTTIPALGTPERGVWDNNYRQAVANYFTDGDISKLKPIKIPVSKLQPNNIVFGNEAKTRLYHRMVRAGDKMPPLLVSPVKGGYRVIDGNRRLDVARANNLTHLEAYMVKKSEEDMSKGDVNITHNPALPPAGMVATSTGGFENYDLGMGKHDLLPGGDADTMNPEDFDQEQLAIGTQHEMEHTEDQELAREIAMDHLAEDPDYYKPKQEKEEQLDKAIADLPEGTRIPKEADSALDVGEAVGYPVKDFKHQEAYSYDHLLTPEQRKAGYSLRVNRYHTGEPGFILTSSVYHNGKPVGGVFGIGKRSVEPHSSLKKEHRGKGLGAKMYEALYAHAHHVEGINLVNGGYHSEAAHRVHASLAKKHGLKYVGDLTQDARSGRTVKLPYKSYSYSLKGELPSTEDLDESNLGNVYFQEKEELDPSEPAPSDSTLDKEALPEHIQSMRANHKLVPGQILDSRHVVVQTPSGKNAVRQVAAGQKRDLTDSVVNPLGPGLGNPTSTRNKPSREIG